MKNFYTTFFFFFLLQWGLSLQTAAQCADGSNPTPVFMDTTIRFDPGVSTTQVKFPQFNPEEGMLRCVRLTVTMTGIVDTVYMQNFTNTTQTARFEYTRTDMMQGPGLTTALTNSANKTYGNYNVDGFDGDMTTGSDNVSIPRDTVVNRTVVRTLTDSTEIAQFYGHDSVTYVYDIDARTTATMTGGNSMALVRTSALVHFRFEYCTCSNVTLPLGLKNFTVTKTTASAALLSWEGENDPNFYRHEVEVSRDGKTFTRLATVEKKNGASPRYQYAFSVHENEYGQYYFRVRQQWQNGTVRYTAIKPISFGNPIFEATRLYPNPSQGSLGIRFAGARASNILVQVTNAGGQQVLSKTFQVAPNDYKTVGNLPAGTYWVKLTDLASKTAAVKQLVVQ
ncbi:T9SS type A sorting domain-containing protein [Flavisolibacter sp. BT320]|nr:T9SS type A sorting domain-containing protein [Flavisolibacter longurius]